MPGATGGLVVARAFVSFVGGKACLVFRVRSPLASGRAGRAPTRDSNIPVALSWAVRSLCICVLTYGSSVPGSRNVWEREIQTGAKHLTQLRQSGRAAA